MVSDISSQGVALIVSEAQADHYKLKDRITVESLGESKILPSIIGEVIFKNPHPSGTKVGIRMTSQFPKQIFDDFIVREKFFSVTNNFPREFPLKFPRL